MTKQCPDPERERNHVLGTMAASCHTCAMESTHGWMPGDRAYVRVGSDMLVVTIDNIDASRGIAYVTLVVNGVSGTRHFPIGELMGMDVP